MPISRSNVPWFRVQKPLKRFYCWTSIITTSAPLNENNNRNLTFIIAKQTNVSQDHHQTQHSSHVHLSPGYNQLPHPPPSEFNRSNNVLHFSFTYSRRPPGRTLNETEMATEGSERHYNCIGTAEESSGSVHFISTIVGYNSSNSIVHSPRFQ